MTPVVLLMGPTASGKTGLALELAQHLPLEIVSVDSAQVYRGMDIGTAKPSAPIRAGVPHHLIDVADPSESYSAARFRAEALAAIEAIRARGRVPLLAGGTMLYFQALQHGLSELPPADPELRVRIEARAAREGWAALHAELARLDPPTAQRLHPNDAQRIQRALEIAWLTGEPPSRLQRGRQAHALPGPAVKLALWPPERAALHADIARRFDQMMRDGFLDEVRALRARGDLHADLPSMRAVGYRQLWAHLDGVHDLATAVARGVAATRRLAKRQFTWLRSESDVTWLSPGGEHLAARALERIKTVTVEKGAC